MKALAQLRVHSVGEEQSQQEIVSAALQVLDRRNLQFQVHAMGTEITGDLDTVLAALRDVHAELHKRGVTRLETSFALETRTDKQRSLGFAQSQPRV